jgi:hypothetical protein
VVAQLLLAAQLSDSWQLCCVVVFEAGWVIVVFLGLHVMHQAAP